MRLTVECQQLLVFEDYGGQLRCVDLGSKPPAVVALSAIHGQSAGCRAGRKNLLQEVRTRGGLVITPPTEVSRKAQGR